MSAPPTSPTPVNTAIVFSDDNNGRSAATTYFFGFLIAFLVILLLTFGTCACRRSNRRRLNRRGIQDMLDGVDERHGHEPIVQYEPTFWEPALAPVRGDKWNDLTPLSASFVQTSWSKGMPTSSSRSSIVSAPHSESRGHPALSWFRRSTRNEPTSQPVPEKPIREVQVALLISMPSASPQRVDSTPSQLPEYQIGVTRVPWSGETRS